METSTTILKMLSGNYISVPNYQRAYSWDSGNQIKQFLIDIDEYIASKSETPYYFGHFLFEKRNNDSEYYNIIDGQQRLTTIEIFLSALFEKLNSLEEISEELNEIKEDMIKRNSKYRFSTVDYDNPFFKDYVINHTKSSRKNIETLSAKRIADAYDFFCEKIKNKTAEACKNYILCIKNSKCTTHIVNSDAEAIQMFIFQNNRGKRPTKLEIIKAQFMYEIQISSLNTEIKIAKNKELQERFEHIYKAIATIENHIDEDDVLLYALRVYFNTFDIDVSTDKIEKELKNKENLIEFIMNFTLELEKSFESLKPFFNEKNNYEIYSFALLGKTKMLPFAIKAYEFNIPDAEKEKLFKALESIVLRHRIIGTRAHLEDRINDVYKNFTKENLDVEPIIERIKWIEKDVDLWWWQYWSDDKFRESLKGNIEHKIAKHLLWKYENYLLSSKKKKGYKFMMYNQIEKPELEHIAPQTPTNGTPVATGYCKYDDDFINEYLNCIGNYLLISKSHNSSIGNIPFKEKRDSYNVLEQQREICEMTNDKPIWNKKKIKNRRDKIIKFIVEEI